MATGEAERETRKKHIDPRLVAAGWTVIPHSPNLDLSGLTAHAIEEYPTENGPADYALVLDGALVGIVEAKRVMVGAQNVLQQAKRYSAGLSPRPYGNGEHGAAFLYATNGEIIRHLDTRGTFNLARDLSAFHTPDALREKLSVDLPRLYAEQRATPFPEPLPGQRALRDYQREAIEEIEKALIGAKREMLLSMATGTGKTFTIVALVDRLLRSGAATRILFLVDRRALAAQAVQAFGIYETVGGSLLVDNWPVYSQPFKRFDLDPSLVTYEPKRLPEKYLTTPKRSQPFVYVSTIQRLARSLFGYVGTLEGGGADPEYDADADTVDHEIPIHAFDLVIADECHRGYTSAETNVWRQVINHFDSVKLGLTATPAPHTLALFREKVYEYPLRRAIDEGYLVDFDEVHIKSGVYLEGIRLSPDDEVEVVDTETGAVNLDVVEDERHFDVADVERKITAPDCTRKIVAEIVKHMKAHETAYGRLPKTLVFAANDLPHTSHAQALVDEFKLALGRGDDFVQKITGAKDVDAPLQRIREFRNRPEPIVVVSVDMLSTGVDIPSLEFIVLARPVKSRVLWDQMLGRGTRKFTDLSPAKDRFVVVDCFGGTLLEFFRNRSAFQDRPPRKPTATFEQIIAAIADNEDVEHNLSRLRSRFNQIDRRMTAAARAEFAAFVPDGDMKAFGDSLSTRFRENRAGLLKILQTPDFIRLLYDYERAKRTFWKAIDYEDQVESEMLIRHGDAAWSFPDYIEEFHRYVQENRHHVDAIAVLLDRPADLSTTVLEGLYEELAAQPQGFTVEKLRRAYKTELADIISLIKHAADSGEPLLSTEQRVDQAIAALRAGRQFTEEQERWLARIRGHLIKNLVVEREDFDVFPIFANAGGSGRAERVFEGDLEDLLKNLNMNIAS